MRLSTVILPSQRWAQSQVMWTRAESLGLHAGYTYDHLSWRTFRERPWFTMVPTLAAAAAATRTLRLGPLVTSPNFRHPLLLAKDLLALDDISKGRLIVGVGSGGTGFDATVLSQAPWSGDERHRRFVEFTRALDTLLREPASTLDGEFYPIIDSRQLPGPVQSPRPPLYLSALGPKSLALAAELAEGWVSFGSANEVGQSTFDAVSAQVRRLDEELDRRGRTVTSMHRVLLDFGGHESPLGSLETFLDWAGRYRSLGFDELVVHWPIPDSEYDVDIDRFERIVIEGGLAIADW
jgi:alkanesulfonate monooxygenase SsuD/methylene tetrahydromethanopterin reductase-like flavin-dependent oxidoreductase (luciferase family)